MLRLLFALILACAIGIVAVADQSCAWHKANDFFPDYIHYDAFHDDDGDGHGCVAEFPRDLGPAADSSADGDEEAEADATPDSGSGAAESGAAAQATATPVWVEPTLHVVLLYRSNFRARAGIENAIVGVADAGSAFAYVMTGIDNEARWWYQVELPSGWGWIRSDLAKLEWR